MKPRYWEIWGVKPDGSRVKLKSEFRASANMAEIKRQLYERKGKGAYKFVHKKEVVG